MAGATLCASGPTFAWQAQHLETLGIARARLVAAGARLRLRGRRSTLCIWTYFCVAGATLLCLLSYMCSHMCALLCVLSYMISYVCSLLCSHVCTLTYVLSFVCSHICAPICVLSHVGLICVLGHHVLSYVFLLFYVHSVKQLALSPHRPL